MDPDITKNDHVTVPGAEESSALKQMSWCCIIAAVVTLHNARQRQLEEELGLQFEGTAHHDQESNVTEV